MTGRHRVEDGGRTVADTITNYRWLKRMLTWPNPFLAPTVSSYSPGDVRDERQLRNTLSPGGAVTNPGPPVPFILAVEECVIPSTALVDRTWRCARRDPAHLAAAHPQEDQQ